MSESQEQDFFKWQEEFGNSREEQGIEIGMKRGIKKGRKEERIETIKKLSRIMAPEEVSEILEIPLNEIKHANK